MANTTATATPVTAISLPAARLSFAAAALSLVLLAALHVLSPEFDPSWRMVSEYASGDYGGVLALMFLSMAGSSVALFFAIKSQIRTIAGKFGLAAIGLFISVPRPWVGILLVLYLIAVFPANVQAARLETKLGNYRTTPLWLRAPIQLLFIAVALWVSR